MIGIDLSNQNGKLASIGKAQFVIAKCTEGTDFVDNVYAHNAWLAESSHAQFGAYHFFHAENLNAREQAKFFMSHARPRTFLGMWVDYETYGASGATDAGQIGLFIATIKEHYPKAKVGVYANTVGLKRIYPHWAEVGADAVWFAGPSVPMTSQVPGLPTWLIHQYATVGNVDQDYTALSELALRDYFAWLCVGAENLANGIAGNAER